MSNSKGSMEVVQALAQNSQQKINCGKVGVIAGSRQKRTTAIMIDDKLNELCRETGLIKTRLLESIDIYAAKWAKRCKGQIGLSEQEKQKLNDFFSFAGNQLQNYQVTDDIASNIDDIHRTFFIFKAKLLSPLNKEFHQLKRKSPDSEQTKKILSRQLKKIGEKLATTVL